MHEDLSIIAHLACKRGEERGYLPESVGFAADWLNYDQFARRVIGGG